MKGSEKLLARAAIALLALSAVVYAGDWLVLSHRISQGSGYGTVEVNQFLSTSLKGNKTEYDLTGTQQVKCVQSAFPHQGYPTCWWTERHNSQWQ